MKNMEKQKIMTIALSALALATLVACGGNESSTTTNIPQVNSTISSTISPDKSGVIKSDTTGSPLVVFSSGVTTTDTVATVQTLATHPNPESNATLTSQVVSFNIDPGSLSDTDTGTITVYIPSKEIQAGLDYYPSSIEDLGAVVVLSFGDASQDIKRYATAKIDSAQQSAYNVYNKGTTKLSAVVTIGKQELKAARGRFSAAVYSVANNAGKIPDGQLFKLEKTVDYNVSTDPSRINTSSGKTPLVLVHGIQAECQSNPIAYKDTWKEFRNFFYTNDSAKSLQDKFDLYSYSYNTGKGIGENGTKLADELKTRFGTTKVVILAHSMGGLVSRFADVNSKDGLLGLVTLNTPHHGTTQGIVNLAYGVSSITTSVGSFMDSIALLAAPVATISETTAKWQSSISSRCPSILSLQGAKDLQFDYFDSQDEGKRCNSTTDNKFLCADGTGLNRKPLRSPMYMYSSVRKEWSPSLQAFSGNFMLGIALEDGDVPLASQIYATQKYGENQEVNYIVNTGFGSQPRTKLAPIYKQRTEANVNTAPTFKDIDHVQIHDSLNVFTGKGDFKLWDTQSSGGLVADLISLLPKTASPNNTTPTTNISSTITIKSITGGAKPVISGTFNIPGGTSQDLVGVVINIYDGTTRLTPPATVTGSTWTMTPSEPLATGVHNLTASLEKKSGTEYVPFLLFPITSPVWPHNSAATYAKVGNYDITECVKDTKTGLIWEGKTASGWRAGSNVYTNYNANYGTPAQISAGSNAAGYVNTVNSVGLCGFNSGWRMPTIDELKGLVDTSFGSPTIDTAWFPNTPASGNASDVWSGSPYANVASSAWYVYFGNGGSYYDNRYYGHGVRLVRGGQ